MYRRRDWIENNTPSKELKENEAVEMHLNMKRVKYLRKAYLGATKERKIFIAKTQPLGELRGSE